MSDISRYMPKLDNADQITIPDIQPINLIKDEDGRYREIIDIQGKKYEAAWTLTDFSNGACPDGSDCSDETCELGHITCSVCEKDIWDGGHFMCLEDGSDSAHKECVRVISHDVAELI